jgi:hypothetical protein
MLLRRVDRRREIEADSRRGFTPLFNMLLEDYTSKRATTDANAGAQRQAQSHNNMQSHQFLLLPNQSPAKLSVVP